MTFQDGHGALDELVGTKLKVMVSCGSCHDVARSSRTLIAVSGMIFMTFSPLPTQDFSMSDELTRSHSKERPAARHDQKRKHAYQQRSF